MPNQEVPRLEKHILTTSPALKAPDPCRSPGRNQVANSASCNVKLDKKKCRLLQTHKSSCNTDTRQKNGRVQYNRRKTIQIRRNNAKCCQMMQTLQMVQTMQSRRSKMRCEDTTSYREILTTGFLKSGSLQLLSCIKSSRPLQNSSNT